MGMGTRAHGGGNGSSERLRTIWTPDMDRYFIGLMVEQVRKGNWIDARHLFTRGAWKLMTSSLNAKFHLQFEKNVLKNRHKTLRIVYRTVRALLSTKGFGWDNKRQMVTADNHVWDQYIKVHPEARSYRIKTIPYYGDLCLIYNPEYNLKAEDTSCSQNSNESLSEESPCTAPIVEEQFSSFLECSPFSAGNTGEPVVQRSSGEVATAEALHDIVVDADFGSSMAEAIDGGLPEPESIRASTIGARTRTYWQPTMDLYFIDLLLEQVKKGNQVDGLFHKQAWSDMLASFNAKFGFNYGVDILKNRYKTLRRQHNALKNILELDGFSWDKARQMVTADNFVWQDYIKAHADARQYMTRRVPYYQDLCVIFKESSLDENKVSSAHNLEEGSPDVKLNRPFKELQSPAASDSSNDKVEEEDESSQLRFNSTVTDHKNKCHLENLSASASLKKARTKEDGVVGAILEMASAVSSLADKRKEEDSNYIPIENVVEAIQALPDMDEDFILDACDFLEDERKAKTFLALDFRLRKKWLMRKLRPEQTIQ